MESQKKHKHGFHCVYPNADTSEDQAFQPDETNVPTPEEPDIIEPDIVEP